MNIKEIERQIQENADGDINSLITANRSLKIQNIILLEIFKGLQPKLIDYSNIGAR